MTTITSSTTLAITLTSPAYTVPVVVERGVTIAYSGGGPAIYNASGFWTIQNSGAVSGYYGIFLNGGGTVTNASGGTIEGYGHGIAMIDGLGVIVNSGTITAAATIFGYGVRLAAGGSVINTASASISGGFIGVHISNALGTVVNDGNIAGVAQNDFGYGVRLAAGGLVTNGVGGLIRGSSDGISISEHYNGHYGGSATQGTVVNYGSIYTTNYQDPFGSRGYGIIMAAGGVVINAASALIAGGDDGVYLQYESPTSASGTVINKGRIVGTGINQTDAGVKLDAGGLIINESSAFIGGSEGVLIGGTSATLANYGTIIGSFINPTPPAIGMFGSSNTLTNGGTIIGEGGIAVEFAVTANNLLVLDPGATFQGVVVGGNSAQNTIELASGASTGTLTGLGTQFTNFGSIAFETGPGWFIAGNTSGLAGVISGFSRGDTIEVTGITVTGSSYVGGILTLAEASGYVTLNLPGSFATGDFVVTNVADGTDIEIAAPCFARGTSLATPHGEVPIEALREGENVLAHLGDGRFVPQPITWIGRRKLDCSRHSVPSNVWPVRISVGAFGKALPRRDLWLSPDHAVFVDDLLIPIKYLINGCTVVQEPRAAVIYYHIELGRHGVVLADGLPTESYLDIGARSNFDNGGGPMRLHPDFSIRAWEADGCAPLVITGKKLRAVRQRMMKRAKFVRRGMVTLSHVATG